MQRVALNRKLGKLWETQRKFANVNFMTLLKKKFYSVFKNVPAALIGITVMLDVGAWSKTKWRMNFINE